MNNNRCMQCMCESYHVGESFFPPGETAPHSICALKITIHKIILIPRNSIYTYTCKKHDIKSDCVSYLFVYMCG